jgi:hypothetical protein
MTNQTASPPHKAAVACCLLGSVFSRSIAGYRSSLKTRSSPQRELDGQMIDGILPPNRPPISAEAVRNI